jgi:Viral BACON domain
MSFTRIGLRAPLLLAILIGGCRSSPPAPGGGAGAAGAGGRAQPTACTTDATCPAGTTCALGTCANPTPTASHFAACALDLDCTAGDHCALGACAHDCVADRDCASDAVCDVRGRCTPPSSAGQPPPLAAAPATPAQLSVDPPSLSLPAAGGSTPLTIRNTGGAALDFRVLAGASWIDATPATGSIAAGESATVTVAATTDTQGASRTSLSVVTAGGTAVVPLAVPARLSGLYRGMVRLTSPEPLGSLALALHVDEDATGHLTGVVDGAESPAFPFRAALTPDSAVTGDQLALGFLVPALRGTPANPDYPQDLVRHIQVVGTVSATGHIAGTYTETIDGVFEQPAALAGTVALDFVSTVSVAPAPEVPTTTSVMLPSPPVFGACAICPSGRCTGNPLEDGADFLRAATPFLGNAIANKSGADAYLAFSACADTPSSCLDHVLLQCAQSKFFEAIAAKTPPTLGCQSALGPTADCATRGLLDTFKALLMADSVIGNEWLTRAQESASATLAAQEEAMGHATTSLQAGYESEAAGAYRVRGLLDPYFVNWISKLPPALFSGTQLSFLSEGLAVAGDTVTPHLVAPLADFDRLAKALANRFDATVDDLQLRHRLGLTPASDLVLVGSRAVASAHLELGLAATLGTRLGASGRLTAAVAAADRLAGEVEQISQGFNPAGYQDDYIAYTYNPAVGATSNNFKSQLDHLRTTTLTTAKASFTDALAATRTFESDENALATEIATYDDKFGTSLAQLCGGTAASPSFDDCGAVEGQVFDARQEVIAAGLKGQDAILAVENAYSAIDIEMDRASQVSKLHIDTVTLINADGTKLNALAKRETEIAQLEAAATGIMGTLGALSSGNIAGAVSASAGAAGAIIADQARLDITKQRNDIATTEKARVEFNAANEVLIDSAARVKTALLDIPKDHINVSLAQIDVAQAVARFRSLYQQALDQHAARASFAGLTSSDPRRDPSFRLYRDHRVDDARRDFDTALAEVFIVTRSLEYELNYTYADRAYLFTLSSPFDLESYAQKLESTYDEFVATIGPSQGRANTISLRDQIYKLAHPITDTTTAQVYAPEELFHRLLADPSNRDADGNLRLSFSTSLAPDSTLFSTNLCNDRLTGLRASLVGATLGVTQPEVLLQQKGTGYLRSCREKDASGDYAVRDYGLDESALGRRNAVIQTGVNLSGPNDVNGPPVNTELYGRPLAATYELVIDRSAPANAGLDLTHVDDIVLFVSHETRTVQ